MGTLYVVSTPIGNLEDITLRAIRVLSEVSLIAAEDTRTPRKLLARYNIHVPLLSYNEHNADSRHSKIFSVLNKGDVALVSEAGTPAVSDPGARLIHAVVERNHNVTPIPGASAVTTAVSISGLSGDAFCFLGFLPRGRRSRLKVLRTIANLNMTLIVFESPHRIRFCLEDMISILGDRQIIIGRELSKLHEEFYRGSLSGAHEYFQNPRGEFVLVISGDAVLSNQGLPPTNEPDIMKNELLRQQLTLLKASGISIREAATQVGLNRRWIYKLWQDLS